VSVKVLARVMVMAIHLVRLAEMLTEKAEVFARGGLRSVKP
jgi:hypothetical protein